jgi:hypothetical protein
MHLADVDPSKMGTEKDAALAANAQVMREYVKGSVRAIVSTGEAEQAYVNEGRKISRNVRANAAVSIVGVYASALEMKAVVLDQTEAIGGW